MLTIDCRSYRALVHIVNQLKRSYGEDMFWEGSFLPCLPWCLKQVLARLGPCPGEQSWFYNEVRALNVFCISTCVPGLIPLHGCYALLWLPLHIRKVFKMKCLLQWKYPVREDISMTCSVYCTCLYVFLRRKKKNILFFTCACKTGSNTSWTS